MQGTKRHSLRVCSVLSIKMCRSQAATSKLQSNGAPSVRHRWMVTRCSLVAFPWPSKLSAAQKPPFLHIPTSSHLLYCTVSRASACLVHILLVLGVYLFIRLARGSSARRGGGWMDGWWCPAFCHIRRDMMSSACNTLCSLCTALNMMVKTTVSASLET